MTEARSARGSVLLCGAGRGEAPWRVRNQNQIQAEPNRRAKEGTMLELRREVAAFAQLMEQKLRENDKKGGWKHCETAYLSRRCGNELEELRTRVKRGHDWMRRMWSRPNARGPYSLSGSTFATEIGLEAADVANFAMMIADVCGALAQPDGGPHVPR